MMKARWIAGFILVFGVLALFPARAYAHHCDTAAHCFETGQPAAAWVVVFGAAAFIGASIAFDLFVGPALVRGLIGAITGRDPVAWSYEAITGLEAPGGVELETWERVTGWIPLAGRTGGLLRTAGRTSRYLNRTIDILNTTSRVLDVANTVRGASGASTGIDPLTGQELSLRERWVSGLRAADQELLAEAISGYPVRGGGEQLQADGIREDNWYLQETKHGGASGNSPFRDDSRTPSPVREKIRQQAEDEVYKYGRIIKDPDSPYQGLEYITSDEGVKRFYEDLLLKHDVPGHVRVEEQ